MKKLFLLLLIILISAKCFTQNYLLKNGKIWNGQQMELKNIYLIDSVFSFKKPSQIDSILDLSGQFVIPPFGDFHTHLFDGDYSKNYDTLFLEQGIFYAHDLVNDPEGSTQMRPYFNQNKTLDVAYANGCLTSNYGHPIAGYERMELKLGWRLNAEQKKILQESRTYQDKTYYIIDQAEDVAGNMNKLFSTQPDAIKIILFHSEEYEWSDTFPVYNKGLDPAVLPAIMERAKAKNLRVVAHVESEYDLWIAMKAGITYFAHIPYYGYENRGASMPILSDSILQKMSEYQVKVSPTLSRTFVNLTYLPKEYQPDSITLEGIKAFHIAMLRSLKKYKIQILAGADFNNMSAIDEIMYYNKLKVFESRELLQMLIHTGKEIFPGRKIAALKEGFEANCLILNSDPTENIENIKTIALRIKSGKIIP